MERRESNGRGIGLEELQVELPTARGRVVGVVERLSVERDGFAALVVFRDQDPPEIELGAALSLAFHAPGRPVPLAATGRVAHRLDEDEVRFVFLFRRSESQTLLPLFNRRNAARVRPSAEQPLEVEFHAPDGSWSQRLPVHDLSTSGLAVPVASDEERHLARTSRARLRLLLPDVDEPLELACAVLYRRFSGATVVYGVQFEELDPFDERARALRVYVARRQNEEQREARRIREKA